jgi:hypothetical protein
MACGILVGLALGAAVAGRASQSANATTCLPTTSKQWAYIYSNVAAYGIDGYLGYDSTSIAAPDCDAVVSFIVAQLTGHVPWVQAGVYTGRNPDGNWYSTYRIYTDNTNECSAYDFTDFGNTVSTNYAYYMTYTGWFPGSSWCGNPAYTWAIRVGDWYNAPIDYRTIDVSNGQWSAQLEVHSRSGVWPNNGARTFGSPSSDLSHGMSWYDQPNNTWGTWGSTQSDNGPLQQGGSTYKYCVDVAYRASHTIKGNTCP